MDPPRAEDNQEVALQAQVKAILHRVLVGETLQAQTTVVEDKSVLILKKKARFIYKKALFFLSLITFQVHISADRRRFS